MRLLHNAGEPFQFDWSEEWAVLGGERTKLQVAHFKLSYSRAFIVRAYPLQTHEMLFDAHYHAFRVLGGVPRRGIYDNMRTAVDRVGYGKERQVNARFLAMASHYLFDPEFCNPAAGWEKGQVEKNVQDVRHRLWQPMPCFADLDVLNAWLERQCVELWGQVPHGTLPGTIAAVWGSEKPSLMALPPAFDGFVEHTKRVSWRSTKGSLRSKRIFGAHADQRPRWSDRGPFRRGEQSAVGYCGRPDNRAHQGLSPLDQPRRAERLTEFSPRRPHEGGGIGNIAFLVGSGDRPNANPAQKTATCKF